MTTATLNMEQVGAFAQQIGGMLAGGATTAMMVVGDRTGLYAAMAAGSPWMHRRTDQLVEAFRTGAGIPWAEQDPTTFESAERFFRVGYRNSLVSEWIPALDGVHEKLQAGARLLDVGCGRGAPLLLLAQAYPASQFLGYDAHPESIETATRRAAEAGVSDQVRFEVNFCHGYQDRDVDVITFFDAFHDLGDPVGAASHARRSLAADGTLVLVEPRAADDLATTMATIPMAALAFASSTFLCTPNSLSQPVGLALGAQAGEARLRDVLSEAGYRSIRRAAENDFQHGDRGQTLIVARGSADAWRGQLVRRAAGSSPSPHR